MLPRSTYLQKCWLTATLSQDIQYKSKVEDQICANNGIMCVGGNTFLALSTSKQYLRLSINLEEKYSNIHVIFLCHGKTSIFCFKVISLKHVFPRIFAKKL